MKEYEPLAERIREIVKRDASREDRTRATAEEIRCLGPYRWVGIYGVTQSEVRNIAFSGPGAPEYPVFSRDKGLTGEMLRRNESVICGDVSNDPNYLTAFSTTRSEMIVPVRSRNGDIIGTIDVESESPNAFGDEDRATVEAIATIIEPLFWVFGAPFLGLDHIDTRVADIAAVERFYDELMPELGLTQKRYAYVDVAGNWHRPEAGEPYNAIEYYEEAAANAAPRFIGFIEDAGMTPLKTRIAFRIADAKELERMTAFLAEIGAKNVERSADMQNYPAVFFEDPAGTCLELCARA